MDFALLFCSRTMKLKNYISLVLLIVLMFQVLPIKQLGNLLFSNQLQEELPHGADDVEKDAKAKVAFKKDFCAIHDLTQLSFLQITSKRYIHFAIALPAPHAGEIHTPPPNLV